MQFFLYLSRPVEHSGSRERWIHLPKSVSIICKESDFMISCSQIAVRAMLIALCLCPVASADYVLGLQYDGTTDTSLVVNAGDTLTVNMLISETAPDTLLFDEGLGGGGGRIVRSGSANVSLQSVVANSGFDIESSPGPVLAGEVGSILASTISTIGLSGVGVGTSAIHIAQFKFTALGSAGQSATLTSALLGGTFIGNETFGTFTDLDALINSFGALDFTIAGTAVPETSSILLGCVSVVAAGFVGWRRRKNAESTVKI